MFAPFMLLVYLLFLNWWPFQWMCGLYAIRLWRFQREPSYHGGRWLFHLLGWVDYFVLGIWPSRKIDHVQGVR